MAARLVTKGLGGFPAGPMLLGGFAASTASPDWLVTSGLAGGRPELLTKGLGNFTESPAPARRRPRWCPPRR